MSILYKRTGCSPGIAIRMARQQGCDIHALQDQHDGLAVIGTGTGIVLAACDHLKRQYPGLPLMAGDLTGSMTMEQRCIAIDYIASDFPTLLIMWNGIRNGDEYPRFLRERRDFSIRCLWVYSRGLENERALELWAALGARIVENLWSDLPLGNLTDEQIMRPWSIFLEHQKYRCADIAPGIRARNLEPTR